MLITDSIMIYQICITTINIGSDIIWELKYYWWKCIWNYCFPFCWQMPLLMYWRRLMVSSWHWNAFRIIVGSWGKPPVAVQSPVERASDAELRCFPGRYTEKKRTNIELLVNWDVMRPVCCHYNALPHELCSIWWFNCSIFRYSLVVRYISRDNKSVTIGKNITSKIII